MHTQHTCHTFMTAMHPLHVPTSSPHRTMGRALGVLVPWEAALRAARRSSATRCRSANSALSASLLGRSGLIATAFWLSGSRATNVKSATSDASSPYCFCTGRRHQNHGATRPGSRILGRYFATNAGGHRCQAERSARGQGRHGNSMRVGLPLQQAAGCRTCFSSIWMSSALFPVHTLLH